MRCIFLIILTISGSSLFGQEQRGHIKGINIGKAFTLYSGAMEREVDIQLYLPPAYSTTPGRNFPVMYVPDGQEYFLHPIGYQAMLRFRDKSPDFIVIGIRSHRQERRILYHDQAEKFLNFLERELVPFIDGKYRTLKEKERIYFGWEMAGGLGFEIFAKSPGLFKAFFIASPTHLTQKRLTDIDAVLAKPLISNVYFHLVESEEDAGFDKNLQKLDSVFRSANNSAVRHSYILLADEDHYTTPDKTIHSGLYQYFADYTPLRFFSLKEYDNFGDLDAIKSYYKKRAERYDVSPEIQRQTKHFLLLNAMNENNYIRFKYYAGAFKDYLEGGLRRDIWVDRFGKYCLKNNDIQRAYKIYFSGLDKFPDSAIVHGGIGDVYKVQNKIKDARNAYKKAIELAIKNGGSVDAYKEKLKNL